MPDRKQNRTENGTELLPDESVAQTVTKQERKDAR